MDKERINPIIADRDDMIGGSVSNNKGDLSSAKTAARTMAAGMPVTWKLIVLATLFGLIVAAYIGWQQYQVFAQLQDRFEILDSRLNNTDESVIQSGAAMQVSISKQGDELKKHWSEIRKLWGVANDKNKGKIDKNKKDIAFLASKRNELEASIKKLQTLLEKESTTLQNLSENYFGLSADIEALNEASRNYRNALSKVQASLNQQGRQLQNNSEAIKSVDGFRRQINQKLLVLEQRAATPVNAEVNSEVVQEVIQPPAE